MRNTIKPYGIIAFIAIIGFFVISPVHAGGGKDSGGRTASSNVPATLTITGLDAYNGKYIAAETGKEIYAAAAIVDILLPTQSGIIIGAVIENGTATLQVWEASKELTEKEGLFNIVKKRYTGNGPLNFFIRIWEGPEVYHWHYAVAGGDASVKFSNGKAVAEFVLGEGWD